MLERVAASQHFKRAARLREFLLYVGRQSARDNSIIIHEQEIGATVFGRPSVYDTSLDNIVRVNATELRKRLELYFSSEGAEEPVVLEIPRGSYAPIFRRRRFPEAVPEIVPEVIEPVPVATENVIKVERRSVWRGRWLVWACFVVLLAICGFLGWQNLELRKALYPWKSKPALQAFWGQFFDSGQETDVVLADTSFAVAEDIGSRSISLRDYLNYDYKRLKEDPGLSQDRRADLGQVLARNDGSVGDFIVAQRILALDPTSSNLKLRFAREYSPEVIKTNSVILIGSRQSNPWVDLFADRINFSMDYDSVLHQHFVTNRNPKPGEKPTYNRPSLSGSEGLSVIAFLPDLSRNGNALIIEGTDSQATRAAGEFVTSDTALEAFRGKLNSNTFPYFEVLLENSQITGTPLRSEILAYRVYGKNGSPAPEPSQSAKP